MIKNPLQTFVRRSGIVAWTAGSMAACGFADFDSCPPQPRLNSSGADGAADFGAVPVGTSKQLSVYLANGVIGLETYEALDDISITVDGPELSFESRCPNGNLPQAGVCAIVLTWAPSTAYVLHGVVHVLSNAPTSPTTLAVKGVAAP